MRSLKQDYSRYGLRKQSECSIYVYNYKCLLIIIRIHLYSTNAMKYSKLLYIGKEANKLKAKIYKYKNC